LTFLKGAAIGAGLMYLFDPHMGRRRRAYIRDKAVRTWNDTGDAIEAKTHDLSNRAKGVLHDVSGVICGTGSAGSSHHYGKMESLMPSKWSPTTRLLVTAGMGLLAMAAKRRGGLAGAALGAVSMGVLAGTVRRTDVQHGIAGSAPSLPSDYSERSDDDEFGAESYPAEHRPRTARA
jgi:hypothetical protein